MSKLDAQRAMREARYARQSAAAPTRPRAAARPPVAPPTEAAAQPAAATPAPAASDDTCGHKSMNGRACTRPAGHPEKSHRYS